MAGRPESQERQVVQCPPDVRWFGSVMGVPDVRKRRASADVGSDAGVPVVWFGPDVSHLLRVQGHRSSGLDRTSALWGSTDASRAGRPVPAGRPVAGTFPAALLLRRLLVHLPLLLVLAP